MADFWIETRRTTDEGEFEDRGVDESLKRRKGEIKRSMELYGNGNLTFF